MQSTVRLILVLFLVALILQNYNSVRMLTQSVSYLDNQLVTQAGMIGSQVSERLNSSTENLDPGFVAHLLAPWLQSRSLLGVLVYVDQKLQISLLPDVPPEIRKIMQDPDQLLGRKLSVRMDKFLFFGKDLPQTNTRKKLVLVMNAEESVTIESSASFMRRLNFLFIGFAVLITFYFLEGTWRPYRQLMKAAKSAPAEIPVGENPDEAEFLIATFKGVISRLKEKEQELAKLHMAEKARADEVEQLNQDLIRSISSGLILADRTGRIRVFNQAAETIFQIGRTKVLGEMYDKVIQKISPAFKEDIDRCFTDQANINRAELEIKTEGGELRYLGANIMPLQDHQQKFAGVSCLFTDITEFKLLQLYITQKEKFASLGEMAAGVAHEFRNSLATIVGYLQLLENKILPDQKTYTGPINKELILLQKVVNDFLSFARPVELHVTEVKLDELLRDCVSEVKISAVGNPVDFAMMGNFSEVRGDESMLRQLFINLLKNAAESIDGTGRKGRVEINGTTSANGKFSVIEIRDNGLGIPPENLSRIFTPFFSTKDTGVGLGLAIGQKLVLQHNGTISAESLAEGSLFRVQLPLE